MSIKRRYPQLSLYLVFTLMMKSKLFFYFFFAFFSEIIGIMIPFALKNFINHFHQLVEDEQKPMISCTPGLLPNLQSRSPSPSC